MRFALLRAAPYAFPPTYDAALQRIAESLSEQAERTDHGINRATLLVFYNDIPIDMIALPTALLVIDAQQGLLDGRTAVPDARAVIHRISIVLAAARLAGALIIHLQNDGAPGTLDEPGTPGWFIHPNVAPEVGGIVLRKSGDNGFDGTELANVLALNWVTHIAVVGLLSEMCVSATVRGAIARGFHVALVRDAHATYDLEEIPAAIVARVAEHALGDAVDLIDATSVAFQRGLQYK